MTISPQAVTAPTEIDKLYRPPRAPVRSMQAILAFFAMTFVWTWSLWWLASLTKSGSPGLSGALFLASAFGPGLAAIVTTLVFEGVSGCRYWFKACLNWRVGWQWYAHAILVPPLIMGTALAIHASIGGTLAPLPSTGTVLAALVQFPLVLIFGGPLGEEFGWRGYAVPRLSERVGWRWAGLIVGGVWALWHIPLLLMVGTAQADLPMGLFIASTIALSVVMAPLSVNTYFSVLPAILLHSVINWFSMLLPIMPKGGDATAYALVTGIAMLIAVVALAKPGPGRATQGDRS